jgi:hypothetical protein
MRKLLLLVLASLSLLLSACGASTPPDAPAPAVPKPKPDPDQLYEANGMVLEDRTHGPMLCLGAVLESLPPQCGDVPIAGWDWQAVQGEETVGGTTWGSYHVVGKYDGETFTVTDVEPSENGLAETDPDFTSPCPEPPDGWPGLDQATQNDDTAAHAYARSQPDYVTSWVTHLQPEKLEFGPVIVNVVFTGDAERHEEEIRKVWGGPLCVIERDVPSARELARIRKEVEAGLDELGLRMLWSDTSGVEPVIEIGVVVDVNGAAQSELDARYGPGVVRIVPALKPLS